MKYFDMIGRQLKNIEICLKKKNENSCPSPFPQQNRQNTMPHIVVSKEIKPPPPLFLLHLWDTFVGK